LDPGGKGVNVSRALAAAGRPTVAVLPSGGDEGARLAALLGREGVAVVPVPISGAVRSNVTIVELDGTTTKVNETGPTLSAAEIDALESAVVDVAPRATWVVGSGSLPLGTSEDFYADLVGRLRATRTRIAIDTSGRPLAAVIDAKPDLIKPNAEELAELVGAPARTFAEVVSAAESLRARGVGSVLVSLGADGAVLIEDGSVATARAAAAVVRSTVAAGDATLAGFLAGGGQGPDALRTAVAYGTAAVSLPGSVMPGPDDLDISAVEVSTDPDLDRPLGGHRP
jgi:1-phosphofructokinase